MLSFFVKLFKSLNINSHPGEIAHGIAVAAILGFLPKNNIFWYALAIFFFFIRINKGALMLFTALFSLIAPNFDHIFDSIGYFILTIPQLQEFYTALVNIPFVSFTKFYNTIVMGSFISSLIIYIPLYFLARLIVHLWRNWLAPIIRKSKLYMFFKNLPIVQKIEDISDFFDKERL